ncbi:MAG: glycosyltransferase [Solirubrobacterales bacterium]|nr:glycosyltransferase [Solirubrobacterales bacterium]
MDLAATPSPHPLAGASTPASDPSSGPRVAYVATQGDGSSDEARIATLLAPLHPTRLPFDRAGGKARAGVQLFRRLLRERPDVVVMEGTGIAGGAAVIAARALAGQAYVVSSGDAVGPYLALQRRWLAPPGRLYERLLCRLSAGFIGWTPYLVGRAITLGAPTGMTAAHWAAQPTPERRRELRRAFRREWSIPEEAIVVGLVGSLNWSHRRRYSYGLELVQAARLTGRRDLRFVIVGDGDGLPRLRELAGEDDRILLCGRLESERALAAMCAMDAASLPQSLDEVGALRYSTKLSEYLGASLPVLTGRLPFAYDLDEGWLWRIEGSSPWDPAYVRGLARLLSALDRDEIALRQRCIPEASPSFDLRRQQRGVFNFVSEVGSAARARLHRASD